MCAGENSANVNTPYEPTFSTRSTTQERPCQNGHIVILACPATLGTGRGHGKNVETAEAGVPNDAVKMKKKGWGKSQTDYQTSAGGGKVILSQTAYATMVNIPNEIL